MTTKFANHSNIQELLNPKANEKMLSDITVQNILKWKLFATIFWSIISIWIAFQLFSLIIGNEFEVQNLNFLFLIFLIIGDLLLHFQILEYSQTHFIFFEKILLLLESFHLGIFILNQVLFFYMVFFASKIFHLNSELLFSDIWPLLVIVTLGNLDSMRFIFQDQYIVVFKPIHLGRLLQAKRDILNNLFKATKFTLVVVVVSSPLIMASPFLLPIYLRTFLEKLNLTSGNERIIRRQLFELEIGEIVSIIVSLLFVTILCLTIKWSVFDMLKHFVSTQIIFDDIDHYNKPLYHEAIEKSKNKSTQIFVYLDFYFISKMVSPIRRNQLFHNSRDLEIVLKKFITNILQLADSFKNIFILNQTQLDVRDPNFEIKKVNENIMQTINPQRNKKINKLFSNWEITEFSIQILTNLLIKSKMEGKHILLREEGFDEKILSSLASLSEKMRKFSLHPLFNDYFRQKSSQKQKWDHLNKILQSSIYSIISHFSELIMRIKSEKGELAKYLEFKA